jgi:omega-amidase
MTTILKKSLKLALVQLASGADKAHNLTNARSKVLEAAKQGAKLVVLPECFNSPYGTKYFDKYAETLLPSPPTESQSPTFHALSQLAKEAGVYLVGGSIPEREDKTKKLFNTSLTFSPSGELLATHRKVHLFDIDIPGKIKFVESEVLSPGNKITIVDIPEYGKIAIAICYDIRFPELATIAARKGAFLLLYPGAFNLTTGALHWALLIIRSTSACAVHRAICRQTTMRGGTAWSWIPTHKCCSSWTKKRVLSCRSWKQARSRRPGKASRCIPREDLTFIRTSARVASLRKINFQARRS